MKDVLIHLAGLLEFASQDSYRRLSLLHDVERTVSPWIDSLNLEFLEKDGKSEHREDLLRLRDLFRDFDALSLEEKRQRVQKAQGILTRFLQEKEKSQPALPITSALLRLREPVHYLKGVGPRIGELLARKGVHTIEDLLYFLPRRYEDRRQVIPIAHAVPGKRATIQGRIVEARLRQHRFRKTFDAVIEDETGRLLASWFRGNPVYLKFTLKPGQLIIFTGEIRIFNNQKRDRKSVV
jgi:ATP-dependent DNA helicase RecG